MDCKNEHIGLESIISKQARVWIYQSDREFSGETCKSITEDVQKFVSQWQAHQQDLTAHAFVKFHRFIILVVDEQEVSASGCSIDSSVRFLKTMEEKYQIQLFDRIQIAFMLDKEVKTCSKAEFQSQIDAGTITEKTLVFNNLIQNYGELESHWLIPAKESWHKKVFKFL